MRKIEIWQKIRQIWTTKIKKKIVYLIELNNWEENYKNRIKNL